MQHLVIARRNEVSSTEKEVVGQEETRMKETKRTDGSRREWEGQGGGRNKGRWKRRKRTKAIASVLDPLVIILRRRARV